MKIYLLSKLLLHANRFSKDEEFYAIKNKLLRRHGKLIGYDIQHLEGKKCWTCHGTGLYTGYYWESGEEWTDTCNRCWDGWFKLPRFVILYKYKIGKYHFHKPQKDFHSKQNLDKYILESAEMQRFNDWHTSEIQGYISHQSTKFGLWALLILCFFYEREKFWEEFQEHWYWYRASWRSAWYLPRNWLRSLCHIATYRTNAIPFRRWHKDERIRRKQKRNDLTIWKKEWNHHIDGIPF